KVVHAKNKKESAEAKKELEAFVNEVKKGIVVRPDKEKKLYKVYTKDTNELVGWRGNKAELEKFKAQLQNVKIEACDARCPIHVRLILDEFANIGQIPDFNEKLATMRKYEISCSIILQALSQLKDIYKDKWNTIVANCDTKLFLGCDDSETIEWMLKMLGKKTTTVQNTSWQVNGGGSTSLNKSSIEIMTIDQITMMQDDECLVRIRGVRPYYGKKYELTNHPNYKYAHAKGGQFVIPLAKGVEIRQRGPLHLLEPDKFADDNTPLAKAEKDDPENSVQPHSAPSATEVKNAARKAEAKEAQEALSGFEAYSPETDEMITKGLEDALGIKPGMSSQSIKETIDTLVTINVLQGSKLTYAATD
ncbi:MAG: TraM recognition domain-containing protein, partial [Butyrivibrio sp.]|nr:TraM recognition domain-containing protein [Butyrivibrio sp.]